MDSGLALARPGMMGRTSELVHYRNIPEALTAAGEVNYVDWKERRKTIQRVRGLTWPSMST